MAVKPVAPPPVAPPPRLSVGERARLRAQTRAEALVATEAEDEMRAFLRDLGLAEEHAPWIPCQAPEDLAHVSIEALVRLGLPPRDAATIRAAVGAAPPDEYFCPIACDLMVDPCFAADGHSYEREHIVAWLATHNTSPLTNEQLPHRMVVPNHALKALIWGFANP